MVKYKLHFGPHLAIDFGYAACFAFMMSFIKNLKFQYNIDYEHEDALKISNFEYYGIPIKKGLDEHTHFVTYLFKKYHRYLLNPSVNDIIENKAVYIKGTTPSREAHLIVSWFRFFQEFTYVVPNFYELRESKYPDLAFIYSMLKTMGANHSPLRDMTWGAVQQFMDGRVREGEKRLDKDPSYRGVAQYFSVGEGEEGKPKVLGGIQSYQQLEEAYEKHCGIVAEKLREAIPKGGLQRPNNLPPGRPYQWEYLVFAAT